MGYIALPSILNAIIGITSYSVGREILKIVILHDGVKTIQSGVLLFSLKKEQNLVSFKKQKKTFLFIKKNKTGGLFFFF